MRKTKGKRYSKKEIMENSSNPSQKKEKRKTSPIYTIIILICVAVIIYSIYNIVLWAIENKRNNDLLKDVQSATTITREDVVIDEQPVVKISYDLTELIKRNSDTVGWVYMPNSRIDYPVVQASDNSFYLTHSFNKTENSAGWIFADYLCDVKNSKNVVIYGHNRKDASMFGSLKMVHDDDWLSNPANHYITFADLNGTGIYKIFSVFVANDDTVNSYLNVSFKSDEEFRNYLKKIQKTSSQKFDTNIENTERIITLYTCHGMNNQRLLVFAAKVL